MYQLSSTINFTNNAFRLSSTISKHTTKITEEVIEEGPIKYSTSKASVWRARDTRTGGQSERLWYEPYVLLGSITVFMVYFLMLREENDIDADLSRSLFSRIAGLEEAQLLASLEYNKQRGLDTSAIIARLKELQEERDKQLQR